MPFEQNKDSCFFPDYIPFYSNVDYLESLPDELKGIKEKFRIILSIIFSNIFIDFLPIENIYTFLNSINLAFSSLLYPQ